MKCELVKEKIDQAIFNREGVLSPDEIAHLEICDSCLNYHTEGLKAAKVIEIVRKEPFLNNPEDLTAHILEDIENVEQIHVQRTSQFKYKWMPITRNLLAAASICLMIVFGTEQYQVFDKTTKMETYLSQVSGNNYNGNFRNIVRYNTSFNDLKEISLLTSEISNNFGNKLKSKMMLARMSSLAINYYGSRQFIRFAPSGTSFTNKSE
ncbi:MAG: hypothetical protein Q8O72_07030 [Bacteroidales bacterium]|jgi:hypothetical protein|nr:hypothetical protein [Bacteroidales bacterium]